MVSDLKITVLRCFHPDEVFGDNYPIKKLDWMGQCYMLKDNQEFIVHEMRYPQVSVAELGLQSIRIYGCWPWEGTCLEPRKE